MVVHLCRLGPWFDALLNSFAEYPNSLRVTFYQLAYYSEAVPEEQVRDRIRQVQHLAPIVQLRNASAIVEASRGAVA